MQRRQFLKNTAVGAAALTIAGTNPKKAFADFTKTNSKFHGKKRVAIFGGGPGGLSAAHELIERGYEVTLYETRDVPGGKARSIDVPGTGSGGRKNLPGEHGFRFFPGFYRNLPDTMKRIPFGRNANGVFDNLNSSSEIHFSRMSKPDLVMPAHPPQNTFDLKKLIEVYYQRDRLGFSGDEAKYFAHRMHVFLTSCDERRMHEYEYVPWWDFIGASTRSEDYKKVLAIGATRSLVAMKAEITSTRTIGAIHSQLFMNLAGIGGRIDRLLNAPTNEAWIFPWMKYLLENGMQYHDNSKLVSLHLAQDETIEGAVVEQNGKNIDVEADFYVSAIPMEKFRDHVLTKSYEITKADSQLQALVNLKYEWMNGIQFFFDRDIKLPHGHTIYLDSPWSLTSVSQRQFWTGTSVSKYGDGRLQGILSVDISDWTKPGILYGKPAERCTKEEIKNEVWAQLVRSVDADIKSQLESATLIEWFLDPGIKFEKDGTVTNEEPLLINNIGSWKSRPTAKTKIANLFLSSDYIKTYTDLASMEAANEAARHAVNAILEVSGSNEKPCTIYKLEEPAIFNRAKNEDRLRFKQGLPNKNGAKIG